MPIAPIADRALPSATPSATRAGTAQTHGSEKPSLPAPSPFAELVRSLGHEAERGEATVRGVLSGGAKNLGPSELLALQAGIYRYGETVDLAAKLVDKAGTDVRTVLQGQQ
jgi:hypothetical protein